MTDRPIIFSAAMVRALLDGRKTMTRRLAWRPDGKPSLWQRVQLGDRLWIREGFTTYDREVSTADGRFIESVRTPMYAADYEGFEKPARDWDWSPSIYMPRWASRLTLTVTAAKIERLLDITEEDARAEGFADAQLNDGFGPRDIGGGFTIESPGTYCSAVGMFQITWAKLHPEWDGYSSPEVVAISFSVERRNIDLSASPT